MRHFLTLFDVSDTELGHIFDLAESIKADLLSGVRKPLLAHKVLGLLFEKPSLRTRVSFEAGMAQLGGSSLFLGEDVGWGKREAPQDFSRVIGEYLDVIVCRAKSHAKVEELAKYADSVVVNGLTDLYHPCQAIADLMTIQEHFGSLSGQRLAYIGDGNNVARSLALACAKTGMAFSIAAPKGYELDKPFLDRLHHACPSVEIEMTDDPAAAVRDACAVYTDVWASMGQESEQTKREKDFAPYQVNGKLMAQAEKGAIFLHCLPAKRGQEVTDEVMDSPHSAIIQQAANRMHAQKGLLVWLLTEANKGH